MCKAYVKAKAVIEKEGIPSFYIKSLAELEDFVQNVCILVSSRLGVYWISIFRIWPEPDLPDFRIESGLILPDNLAIIRFFCYRIFIIHPRKYKARERKKTAWNISNSLLSGDGNHMYFRFVISKCAHLIVKLIEEKRNTYPLRPVSLL